MRKYQRIWEALKEYNTASLVADNSVHERIILAVRKEKCKDLGWKLLQEPKKYKLLHTIEGEVLTFSLIESTPVSIDML